jgi:hypothetical protein
MLKHYDDSKRYLTENLDLVCDDTANYLVVWCIDLEIEEVLIIIVLIIHFCLNKILVTFEETRSYGTHCSSMYSNAIYIRIK